MSQKFVMLFLVSTPQIVSLEIAAKILIGEDHVEDLDRSKFKSKCRERRGLLGHFVNHKTLPMNRLPNTFAILTSSLITLLCLHFVPETMIILSFANV